MENQHKKRRVKIQQITKIRSVLQQEINSVCPLCNNADVGHFEIHHIDENPGNNDISNLILVCPTCHSKITKNDILKVEVERVKKSTAKVEIECASITIDSKKCSWVNYSKKRNVFVHIDSNKSSFPIFNFVIINHSRKTIIFNGIELRANHLFSGLSGLPRERILKSIAKFKIKLPKKDEITSMPLNDEIEVPSGLSFKFSVELFEFSKEEFFSVNERRVLYFNFLFNSDKFVSAPTLFLNCVDENQKMTISMLS